MEGLRNMEIYWKDLIVNEKDKQKDSIRSFGELEELEFRCQLCGKPFKLQGRVFKRRFDRDGYFRRAVFACQSKECTHKKKSIVAKSAAVREGQARGAITASAMRKGKTFEELYGIEEAEKKLAKIRAARAAQTGTEHDPRLGKKHSISAKKKMSDHKKNLWQSKDKPYISPLSGEKVTYKQLHQHIGVLQWSASKYNFYITGIIENWHTGFGEKYDSSFERAYMEELNAKKLYWHKNTHIAIPFIDVDGQEHCYVPDILIYSDAEYKELKCILEIKPEAFIKKFETVQLKLKALLDYCQKENIIGGIITEKQLNMERVKELQNENKKNKQKKNRR